MQTSFSTGQRSTIYLVTSLKGRCNDAGEIFMIPNCVRYFEAPFTLQFTRCDYPTPHILHIPDIDWPRMCDCDLLVL